MPSHLSFLQQDEALRDLYDAFNDQSHIDAAGLTPANDDLHRIARLATHAQVASLMGDHQLGLDGLFVGYVIPNWKNAKQYIYMMGQAGLSLPDRDYYLMTGDDSLENAPGVR